MSRKSRIQCVEKGVSMRRSMDGISGGRGLRGTRAASARASDTVGCACEGMGGGCGEGGVTVVWMGEVSGGMM